MTYTTLTEQVAEQGALFNVRTEKLLTSGGTEIDDRVAIVNADSGQSLGLVSPKYKVVTNEEIVGHMDSALQKSGVDLDGMTARVRSSHGGARVMVDIEIPSHAIVIDGDESRLSITVKNSYDGRWKYGSYAGAVRMACLNGQVLGNFVSSYTEFHNSRLDVEAGADKLVGMVEDFHQAEDWFKRMIDRKIDREQLLRSIAVFTTGKSKIEDREEFLKKPTVRKIEELYLTYSTEMGQNAWALYNAMTDFVSHRNYKEGTHAASLDFNREKLRATLSSAKVFA